MLVLSRKVGERIHVGDDVVIELLEIDRNKVRLGIIAPRNIPVHRGEIWVRIQEDEQERTARSGDTGDIEEGR